VEEPLAREAGALCPPYSVAFKLIAYIDIRITEWEAVCAKPAKCAHRKMAIEIFPGAFAFGNFCAAFHITQHPRGNSNHDSACH